MKSTQAAFWNRWVFCLRVCLGFPVRPAYLTFSVCLDPQQSPTYPKVLRALLEEGLLAGEIQTHVTFLVLANFGYLGSVHIQMCSSHVLLRPSFSLVLKRLRLAFVVVFNHLCHRPPSPSSLLSSHPYHRGPTRARSRYSVRCDCRHR